MNYADWAIAYYDIKSPQKYDKSKKADREKARKNFLNTPKLDLGVAFKALEIVLKEANTEGVDFLKKKGYRDAE